MSYYEIINTTYCTSQRWNEGQWGCKHASGRTTAIRLCWTKLAFHNCHCTFIVSKLKNCFLIQAFGLSHGLQFPLLSFWFCSFLLLVFPAFSFTIFKFFSFPFPCFWIFSFMSSVFFFSLMPMEPYPSILMELIVWW